MVLTIIDQHQACGIHGIIVQVQCGSNSKRRHLPVEVQAPTFASTFDIIRPTQRSLIPFLHGDNDQQHQYHTTIPISPPVPLICSAWDEEVGLLPCTSHRLLQKLPVFAQARIQILLPSWPNGTRHNRFDCWIKLCTLLTTMHVYLKLLDTASPLCPGSSGGTLS